MGLRSWFGTVDQEEAKPEQRSNARLSVHAEVLVSGGPQPSEDRLERADLVDFASGGLRLRTDSPVEVGQTVWVRTTVAHVSQDGLSTELGVTWDAGRPNVEPLPVSVSPESSALSADETPNPEVALALISRGD